MQLCNGDDMGVSQSSVSRAIPRTLESFSSDRMVHVSSNFLCRLIKVETIKKKFFQIAGFPGIVGAHIQIIAPNVNKNVFVNRHHYHSINVQVLFDASFKIIAVVAKWPGSTHDSRILRERVPCFI